MSAINLSIEQNILLKPYNIFSLRRAFGKVGKNNLILISATWIESLRGEKIDDERDSRRKI